jgi:hypothetical protein
MYEVFVKHWKSTRFFFGMKPKKMVFSGQEVKKTSLMQPRDYNVITKQEQCLTIWMIIS